LQRKGGYEFDYFRAKRAGTSFTRINSIFPAMNLPIPLRVFFTV
jgi:hypothetical protein